jgi:hypothetical protein
MPQEIPECRFLRPRFRNNLVLDTIGAVVNAICCFGSAGVFHSSFPVLASIAIILING